jgi:hypothetical protein
MICLGLPIIKKKFGFYNISKGGEVMKKAAKKKPAKKATVRMKKTSGRKKSR